MLINKLQEDIAAARGTLSPGEIKYASKLGFTNHRISHTFSRSTKEMVRPLESKRDILKKVLHETTAETRNAREHSSD